MRSWGFCLLPFALCLDAGAIFESIRRMVEPVPNDELQGGLTEQEKRANVIRLAFADDEGAFQEFCRTVREFVPAGIRGILRGSAVTGRRWRDEAPFDAEGPGTSDLDLTLVGDAGLAYFIAAGFFVPGVHSRPLSEHDPDIAPDLVPLRRQLMEMVKRPVNIQASRDIVTRFRGDMLGQPYLTLFEKPESAPLGIAAGR